jgi:hypothetical protein
MASSLLAEQLKMTIECYLLYCGTAGYTLSIFAILGSFDILITWPRICPRSYDFSISYKKARVSVAIE